MSDKQTVIGPETRISGEVRGDEDLVVHGRIDGRITITGVLSVEPGAIIQAEVQARTVLVSGVLVGAVSATDSVRLSEKARVVGDLNAPRIIIDAGAAYRGHVEMGAVDASKTEARSATRKPAERDSAPAVVKTPPRLAAPSRVATAASPATLSPPRVVSAGGSSEGRAAPPALPRVASAPVRATAPTAPPPSIPRPESATTVATGAAPAWAKKKLRRK